MHSRFLRQIEAQPGRERRVWNITRKHPANGVIDAASLGGFPPNQVMTGHVLHAQSTIDANRQSLGITDEALAGPLVAFPTLRPPIAVYTTDTGVGAHDVPDAYGQAGTLPRANFPLYNAEGFLTLTNDGSTFIQKSATVTTRTRTTEEAATATPQPTRTVAPSTLPPPPHPPRDMFGTPYVPGAVNKGPGGASTSGGGAAAAPPPPSGMYNTVRTK